MSSPEQFLHVLFMFNSKISITPINFPGLLVISTIAPASPVSSTVLHFPVTPLICAKNIEGISNTATVKNFFHYLFLTLLLKRLISFFLYHTLYSYKSTCFTKVTIKSVKAFRLS
jgi:hypothetical protein